MAENESPAQLIYDGRDTGRADVHSVTIREGLVRSSTYRLTLQALNAVGESQLSPELVLKAAIIPSAPQDLHVLSSNDGEISLGWSAPEDHGGETVNGYFLYYQLQASLEGDSTDWDKTPTIEAGTREYTLVGLQVA